MNVSDESPEPTTPIQGNPTEATSLASVPIDESIEEFYQLQRSLYVVTLTLTVIIFISVWIFYSFNIALNYLLGASTGVVYLRMLAKDVERLGREKQRLSSNRLALFIGLIIVATQWHQLKILPIFLGFLTYKLALIIYVLKTTILPESK